MSQPKSKEELIEEFEGLYPTRYNGSYYRIIPKGVDDMTDWLSTILAQKDAEVANLKIALREAHAKNDGLLEALTSKE